MTVAPKCWIGIDTGGTFTDVVLVDHVSGHYLFRKVPSNPRDPAEAILRGMDEILEEAGIAGEHVDFVGLGTTLATNAVLEGKTGRAAMITGEGFTDILELARQRRPHLYNLEIGKPRPPIAAEDRIGVPGRLDETGAVVTPLDEVALNAALDAVPDLDRYGAFAVCFLHAYRNPEHERRAAAILRGRLPEALVCLSSDVNPEFREYERFATTATNASLLPVMDRYLARFDEGVAQRGVKAPAYVIQSNGGLGSPATLRRLPINTFISGPAGGVVGAIEVARASGAEDIITIDIGGTSTDVCLVRNGIPARAQQQMMAGLPVRTASIDVHTIGAGGGSLAWVDAGGLPKVGPESAGAVPGPAAYGLGGQRPTVTDANIVLGRLNPVALLGGRMPVDAAAAAAVIAAHIGKPLGIDVERAAAGILQIANVGITGAVRVISVERGEDPRECALFAFGGGGPLHAAEVAEAMGMRRVIVPRHPGLMSAVGLLAADLRADFGVTCLTDATPDGWEAVGAAFQNLLDRAYGWAADEQLDPALLHIDRGLELRYRGQSSELRVTLRPTEKLAHVILGFHGEHERRFGYRMPDRPVEIVSARLTALALRPAPPPEPGEATRTAGMPAMRPVWFTATGYVPTQVFERDQIRSGDTLTGPAIIEQMDTTTVVPPGWAAHVDPAGNLLLTQGDA
ncbi:MAG TPA: hydantoinase/oxoprolinase family protein [Rhodopila sp.]|nr:hydantoinase/oxoprolinase family protein [Rhodopila sp.]